jgi:HD-GYP domain-containing protein (c-di-GMP phosphodiesterase class II)
MPVEKAASILRAGRGQQWDAAIVDAFLRTIADQVPTAAPLLLSGECPSAYPSADDRPVQVA